MSQENRAITGSNMASCASWILKCCDVWFINCDVCSSCAQSELDINDGLSLDLALIQWKCNHRTALLRAKENEINASPLNAGRQSESVWETVFMRIKPRKSTHHFRPTYMEHAWKWADKYNIPLCFLWKRST